MPAKAALVPKYCLHKPSGRAYVRIRGKVFYVGAYGSADSKREYARLIAETAVQPTTVPTARKSDLTVVELCAAYLDFADGYYRKNGQPTTHMPRLKAAIRVINALYGGTPATSFGPLALRAIQQKMVADNATLYVEPASPWENGYAGSFHSRLRSELTDGEEFASLAEAKHLADAWRLEYNAIVKT